MNINVNLKNLKPISALSSYYLRMRKKNNLSKDEFYFRNGDQNAPLKFSKLFSVVLFAERKSILLIFSSEEDLF